MTPDCMTPAELEGWRVADARYRKGPSTGNPCLDCPLAFAEEMRAVGCCNGRPGRYSMLDPQPHRYDDALARIEARRRAWRMSKRRIRGWAGA
jgi:hypothetical protein